MRKKHFFIFSYSLCAFFFLALAGAISFLRIGVSFDDKAQQARIVKWLLPQSQTHIVADRIDIKWRDFGLDVHVHNLDVKTETTALARFNLKSARVHVHMLRSLLSWRWIFDDISAHKGELLLRDMTPSDSDEAIPEDHLNTLFHEYILPIRYSDIQKIKIGILFEENKTAWLWLEQLKIYLSVYKKYIVAQINPGQVPNAEHIFMQSVFENSQNRGQDNVGEFFIEAKNVDFTQWFNYLTHDADVLSSAINLKASFVYSAKDGPSGVLNLGENHVTIGVQKPQQAYGVHQGQVFLQPTTSGWELLGHKINFFHNGRIFEDWLLYLQKDAHLIQGLLGSLRLDFLGSLLDVIDLFHAPTAELLRAVQLDGIVKNTAFTFDLKSKAYQLNGKIQELTNAAWSGIPAFNKANVDYSLSRQGGRLSLQQYGEHLDFGNHFKKPWVVDTLQADIGWRYATAENKAAVDIHRLRLNTSNAALDAQGHLVWIGRRLPHLKLYSELSVHDVTEVQNYLPLQAMDTNLVEYLSAAFVKGAFNTAQVVWDGPLQDFPYRDQQGMFLAKVPLENTTFAFAPGWRPLEDLQLQLLFENTALDMLSTQGRLGQVTTEKVSARIPNLGRNSQLTIEAVAQGDGQAAADYLLNSPLRENLQTTLDFLNIEGNIDTSFTLGVPLGNQSNETFVSGVVNFNNNDVRLPEDILKFSDVTGQLAFDSNTSRIVDMQARLLETAVNITYEGQSNKRDDTFHAAINLHGEGTESLTQKTYLADHIKMSKDARWQLALDIDIPKDTAYTYQATFYSDLVGIESTLPEPFTKRSDIRTPVLIKVKGDVDDYNISAQYNDWLSAHADIKFEDLHNMQVTSLFVDGGYPSWIKQWHTQPHIQFQLESIDLDAWSRVLSTLKQKTTQKNQGILFPQDIKILGEVKKVTLSDQAFEQFQLDGQLTPASFDLGFSSQQLSGNVKKYTQQSAPVELVFERVKHKLFDNIQHKNAKKFSFDNLLALPWLKIACTDCELLTGLSTDLALEIKPNQEKEMLEIKNISMKFDDFDMQGTMKWQKKDTQIQAQGVCNATVANIENFLKKIGYRSPIHETQANLSGNVSWLSVNLMPDIPTLSGSFNIETGKGALLDVDDASAKILSLIDLNSLVRLLKLDFKDVFGKGFFFTRAALSGQIEQGIVKNDDFVIDGSAGQITGQGQLDLVEEKIDYQLTFIPNLTGSGSVPLVTAFAWNPVAAISVFAASKLLEPVIDVVSRIDYKVTGPLFQPKLEEIRRGKGQVQLPDSPSGESKE